ncbi:polysaccharide biosynthesis/export family protein [Gemmobacter fulvus]|uniref:Polysaccharide biosynthesis/export family protein n=1 Tax=Gemmobacter fulvus TaxID=2840474 RepID=A0A975P4H5_9RHOB|nr:polysaccharide biosynthesis/export family protein [Gemmobacter fulvus]MBT9246692.1 polysaccharide biosynthesis/export family protein [Gemmobacter fulvus]MDQ1846821.1 polysaccharide biosynthesis/export family protein [Gemmobacter fulvus]QWK89202.1 polysaccharide biosynthesis/export family protein [Gemmobacter fulvus]
MLIFAGRLLLLSASLTFLSSCGDLPGGAPNRAQILKGADAPDATFAVFPVTRETLPKLNAWPQKGGPKVAGWISREKGPSSQIIEAGDVMDLSIWDNGESSLLTQTGQKVVELKAIRVSPSGEVFLPYVDQVYVAKMSPDRARDTIQQKFAAIIPSAQVQLSHTAGRQSSVDLVSGVANPGNFVMPDRDFTVLSLLAMGGGISGTFENPQVRLMRSGKLYGISADKLLKSPSLDTTLRGGDKVYVEDDDRYFLSLGAARKEAQIPFPSETITALDAASLIGGVNDTRANPKGVLVLRDYDPKHLRSDGSGPSKERTIFAIDLTTADGLFSAGEFQIEDRDLVLVTESSVLKTNSVLDLLFDAMGVSTRVNNLTK